MAHFEKLAGKGKCGPVGLATTEHFLAMCPCKKLHPKGVDDPAHQFEGGLRPWQAKNLGKLMALCVAVQLPAGESSQHVGVQVLGSM